MCLAIPGKVIEIERNSEGVRMGKANFGGIVKQVCFEYTPQVECGDYVLVHVASSNTGLISSCRRRSSWCMAPGARFASPRSK